MMFKNLFTRKKLYKTGGIFVGICILGAAAFFVFNFRKPQGMAQNVFASQAPFEIATKEDLSEIITSTGTVQVAETTAVYVETSQIVSEIKVKVGDAVVEGQELIIYDLESSRKELENSLKEARISLSNAELSLQSITAAKTDTEISKLEDNIAAAEKTLVNTQQNIESILTKIEQAEKEIAKQQKTIEDYEALLAIGGLSQEEYNNAVEQLDDLQYNLKDLNASLASANLEVDSAERSLALSQKEYQESINTFSSQDTVISYQKQLNEIEKQKMNITSYQDKLNELMEVSTAPVAGTVIEISAVENSTVTEETALLKIADLSNLIVQAYVSEYDVPKIELGQTVSLYTDAIENKTYEGEVTYIAPMAASSSMSTGDETTVLIEITILNPDLQLKPGYSMDLDILVLDLQDVLTVPIGSIIKEKSSGQYFVYLIDNEDTLYQQYIEIGAYGDMSAEVLSGLSEGDRIYANPTGDNLEGMALEDLIDTQSAPPTSGGNESGGGLFGGSGGGMPGGGAMPAGGGPGGGAPGGF